MNYLENNKIDLSVIVLSYNQEQYIRQTIESIVKQKTKYSFEIIIGDDGSTDNTRIILKELEKEYSNIKLIFNGVNLGIIKNYVNILHHASGTYVMECGGDDYWLPGKIEYQMNFMTDNPEIGMSHCAIKTVDEKDITINNSVIYNNCTEYKDLIRENKVSAVSVCFKKELWDKYEKEVNPVEKNWLMEDYPFWLWISKCSVIKYIPKIMCVYRIVQGSLSRQKSIDKQILFQKSAYEIRKYFSTDDNFDAIEQIGRNNIAYIFLCNNDLYNYRKVIKDDKSTKGIIKFYLSYIPGYFYINQLRLRIKKK